MKNVFGDSYDSEPEESLPLPKKFRPPHDGQDGNGVDPCSNVIYKIHEADRSLPDVPTFHTNSMSGSQESDFEASFSESEDENSRFGLGGPSITRLHNQKSSLNESIIDVNSIGYKIMARMGYRPGQTIGLSENSNALMEPLSVRPNPARTGIGSTAFTPRTASGMSPNTISAFQAAAREKQSSVCNDRMLRKLQKFCLITSGDDLRLESGGLLREQVNPLWRDAVDMPPNSKRITTIFNEDPGSSLSSNRAEASSDLDCTDTNANLGSEEKLKSLLEVSREKFCYCPYCGVVFNDQLDLVSNCPGESRESHQL